MAESALASGATCSLCSTCLFLLLGVTAELRAHRREDLVGEIAEPARLESLKQRCGDNGGRHAFFDGREHRPPALARIRYPAFEFIQDRRPGEGCRDQVHQPRADDRATAPHLGDLADMDL